MQRSIRVWLVLITAFVFGVTLAGPAQSATKKTPTIKVSAVSPRTLDAGQYVTVSGSTSSHLTGAKVRLQRRSGKTWVTLASATVSAKRTFTLKARMTVAGRDQDLRVYSLATKSLNAQAASAGKVTVFGWYFLSDRASVDSRNWGGSGSWDINGTTYPKTVYSRYNSTSESWSEWGLARKCSTFRATIGLIDDAKSSAVRHGYIRGDSVGLWARNNISLGQSTLVTLDVTSMLRIRLAACGGTSSANLGFGNAAIRCAF